MIKYRTVECHEMELNNLCLGITEIKHSIEVMQCETYNDDIIWNIKKNIAEKNETNSCIHS